MNANWYRIGTIAYLTNCANCNNINDMNTRTYTNLRLNEKTRNDLKILAALLNRTMIDVAEELIAKALEEAEQKRSDTDRLYGYREDVQS